MFDISGTLILQKEKMLYNGSTSVSYRDVAAGIYIIRVVTPSGKAYSQKVHLH